MVNLTLQYFWTKMQREAKSSVKGLMCLFLIWQALLAADVSVDANIDQNTGEENNPLQGTISITHNQTEVIDTTSFKLGNTPLTPLFIKESVITPGTAISLYSFQLPAKRAGLYMLPPVSVKVAGKIYQSISASYEVIQPRPIHTATSHPISHPAGTSSLRLEAQIKGPQTLYPGERTQLIYRIFYNRSIDLTKSNLPFLQDPAFQKIDDAHIKDYQEPNYTVQEITQEVEALQPGHYQFGPASIEGYSYQLDGLNQKYYESTPLHAEAAAVDLLVKPFPPQAPFSFNGALGAVQVSASLASSKTVTVGDKINLQLKVQGVINQSHLKLPDLLCQPGFSGFFLLNDLPSAAETKGTIKEFHIELTPLTALEQTIPAIQLASFDPATSRYIVQTTEPIPITIQTAPHPLFDNTSALSEASPNWSLIWQTPFQPAPALELPNPFLPTSTHKALWTHTPYVFYLIPLGGLFLLCVYGLRLAWHNRPRKTSLRSKAYLTQATQNSQANPLRVVHLVELACWWRLKERGFIQEVPANPTLIPVEGWPGEVRELILQLQSIEYDEQKDYDLQEIFRRAQNLSS